MQVSETGFLIDGGLRDAGKDVYKRQSHVSLVIAMCLAETVDSLHTCCGITAAKISCQGMGCIIIADCDHGVQIGVYRIPAVLSGYLIIILVDLSLIHILNLQGVIFAILHGS